VELGGAVGKALNAVGVTPDRVTAWLGKPCGCRERKERLDALGFWAGRVVRGRLAGAREYLERILS
jgi:hypothetical protein